MREKALLSREKAIMERERSLLEREKLFNARLATWASQRDSIAIRDTEKTIPHSVSSKRVDSSESGVP